MKPRLVTGVVLGMSGVLAAWGPARGQGPKPTEAAAAAGKGAEAAVTEAVAKLAGQLKKNPVKPSKLEDRLALHMLDLVEGGETLIADEPDPDSNHCGSPRWSHDGKRIIFDSMHGEEFNHLRIKAIEAGEHRPELTDLGAGACPSFSPDDRRIATLLNPDSLPNAEPGIWFMEADGTDRRRAGDFGIPLWSPVDHVILLVTFRDPRQLTLYDLKAEKVTPLTVPGREVHAWPSWAGPGTIVAALATDGVADSIALLDVSKPEEVKIKEVLWKKDAGPDLKPMWPIYFAPAKRCVFVGADDKGMALYAIEPGNPRPRRLESNGLDVRIAGINFSPDGRYLLFCSTRP